MRPIKNSQYRILADLLARGGVAAASDWVTGGGRYTNKRALPLHAKEIRAAEVGRVLCGAVKAAALRLLADRPRVQQLIVIVDLRAANDDCRRYVGAQFIRWDRAYCRGDQASAVAAASVVGEHVSHFPRHRPKCPPGLWAGFVDFCANKRISGGLI